MVLTSRFDAGAAAAGVDAGGDPRMDQQGEHIRILIADDHEVVREGIKRILDRQPGMEIVAEAADTATTLAQAAAHRPDLVLLDISMPDRSGLEIATQLRQEVPDCRILVLSMHADAGHLLDSVRAGAHGYLLKDMVAPDLVQAILAVHRGETYYSPSMRAKLGASGAAEVAAAQENAELQLLTGRERDVLIGVAKGLTNKEMAERLGISHRTVETYRENLMRKLRIHTVAGLTKFAVSHQLVQD